MTKTLLFIFALTSSLLAVPFALKASLAEGSGPILDRQAQFDLAVKHGRQAMRDYEITVAPEIKIHPGCYVTGYPVGTLGVYEYWGFGGHQISFGQCAFTSEHAFRMILFHEFAHLAVHLEYGTEKAREMDTHGPEFIEMCRRFNTELGCAP